MTDITVAKKFFDEDEYGTLTLDLESLRADERVNTRGTPGVDAWAIYGEIDSFVADGEGDSSTPFATVRFLTTGNALFYQVKWAERRAAEWKFLSVPTVEKLHLALEEALPDQAESRFRGEPMVGQLVATDVESIVQRNEPPQARYTFKTFYEKLYGAGV